MPCRSRAAAGVHPGGLTLRPPGVMCGVWARRVFRALPVLPWARAVLCAVLRCVAPCGGHVPPRGGLWAASWAAATVQHSRQPQLQSAAVSCNLLQSTAVRFSVLQSSAFSCSHQQAGLLLSAAPCRCRLLSSAVRCSQLLSAAVSCCLLQSAASAVPQPHYQSRDYWGSAVSVLPRGCVARSWLWAWLPRVGEPGSLMPGASPCWVPRGGSAWRTPSCWLPRHRWGYGGPLRCPLPLGHSHQLQSLAARCGQLQPAAARRRCSHWQHAAVVCSHLQLAAVFCSLVQSHCCSSCSSPAAVRNLWTLQQHPNPVTNHGTIGALLSQRLQLTPAPLPIKGLWGCCTPVLQPQLQLLSISISAATLLLLPPQLSWCCSTPAEAYCSQPPPRYQSRGYGGAALWCCSCCWSCSAAEALLLHRCRSCCSCLSAAALVLLLTSAYPRPVTIRGAMGVLHSGAAAAAAAAEQQHFSCHTYGAAAAAILVLLHTCCILLQPTPAPSLFEGLWECCILVLQLQLQLVSSSISAAADMSQLLQLS